MKTHKKRFLVLEEHLKLLKHAYVGWNDCEFGAPGMDCKRPFGNSGVFADIAEILEIKPAGDGDYDDEFSESQEDYMLDIYKGLEMAMSILYKNLSLSAGMYCLTAGKGWELEGQAEHISRQLKEMMDDESDEPKQKTNVECKEDSEDTYMVYLTDSEDDGERITSEYTKEELKSAFERGAFGNVKWLNGLGTGHWDLKDCGIIFKGRVVVPKEKVVKILSFD